MSPGVADDVGPETSTRPVIDLIRRHVVVHGEVQGVGFRFSTEGEADRVGVAGFVRNLSDGTVEIEVEGEQHEVDRLLGWLRDGGPSGARVDRIDVVDIAPIGAAVFETR